MMKYELAYYEAQKVLLRSNCLKDELAKEFDLKKILEYQLPELECRSFLSISLGTSTC